MLVLSRSIGERIVITSPEGVKIDLLVVEIRKGKMKLGIDAPKNWKVHREEIQAVIDQEART